MPETHPAAARALSAAANAAGVVLTQEAESALLHYLETLLVWRARFNLVSQRRSQEIITKHFEDSLATARFLAPGDRVADLGSGAGFPGLVVALVEPRIHVVLVESRQRRVSFLRTVVRASGAKNIQVISRRAEDLVHQPEFVESFDSILSRAVWNLSDLVDIAAPILRPGGEIIAMRADPAAYAGAGFRDLGTVAYRLSGGEERYLIRLQKVSRETT